jgi:DNA-3-methyladenine glycosylase
MPPTTPAGRKSNRVGQTASPLREGRFLPRSFYARSVHEVARDLLGTILVRLLPGGRGQGVRLAGRIVEVEAYDGPHDLACHASKGRTERTDVMFGEAGHAYVYLIYGMHSCLNIVTGPVGYPAAVLVRALEPLEGVETMVAGRDPAARIASGPGRLTRALRIDRSLNRADLCASGPLLIEQGMPLDDGTILRGPRIGVDYAGPWAGKPWRLGVRGSAALSGPFPNATS